jgi:hypothetical protein
MLHESRPSGPCNIFDARQGSTVHFTRRRTAGYMLPFGGYIAARLLHDPNAGDHRPVAWLIPIACLAGAALLLADWRKVSAERSNFSIVLGVAALVAGIFYAGVFIAFNGMMHR